MIVVFILSVLSVLRSLFFILKYCYAYLVTKHNFLSPQTYR
jgi:hypothetical protein